MVVKGREIERSRSFAQCMAQPCTGAEKPPMSLWHGPMWNSQPVPRMNPRPTVPWCHGINRCPLQRKHLPTAPGEAMLAAPHKMSPRPYYVLPNEPCGNQSLSESWCELIANVLRISTAFGRIFLRISTPLFLLPSGKRSHITNWKITMHFVNG
jgi:hypothetical protein